MRWPPIEKETPRHRHVDVVMPQQIELIEHEQEAGGIAAAVDAVELTHVLHVFGPGACNVILRASHGTHALVEPGTGRRNGLALCLG